MSLQAGWLPFARHAWAYNLWQYLPPWAFASLAAAALALASSRVREAALAGAARLSSLAEARHPFGSGWRGMLGAWAALVALLWLVRDRQMLGDANILIWQAASGKLFLFPDVGASFLIGAVVRAARAFGLEHEGRVAALQLALCASGAFALLCVWRAGRELAPGHGGGVALLLVSGGLLRVFAGHVEVYGFLLAAAGAYLWSALAHLGGRAPWTAPCLALGVAAWLHPSAVLLLPSLALLLLREPAQRPWRRIALGLGLVLLPWLVFAPVMAAIGDRETLEHAREVFFQVLGRGEDPSAPQRWVRGWGGAPSVGTDYVFLAPAHLKYLANAFHLLCAWALPALLLLAVRRRVRFATPAARFLAVASLPLVAYALVLRPVWGPFDWDLFSLTALFVASLSAHLLAGALAEATLRHVLAWLVGFNLLFCGVPMLTIGFAPIRASGPLVPEAFDVKMLDPSSDAFARIAPWL